MPRNPKSRDEADAKFVRAQKAAQDGKKALTEYETEAQRINANTQRLRALRLAKEAADLANPPPPKKKPTRARKKPAA